MPKGIMLSHDHVIGAAGNSARVDGLTASDDMLAYLPLPGGTKLAPKFIENK